MISVLAPESSVYELQLERVIAGNTFTPFEPIVIEFIDALSKSVLLDDLMARLPEMAALAHWIRRAHLVELRSAFEQIRGDRIWLPRGMAVHYAPANVDSLFVYSWLISLLVGNKNIIRLSERRGEQVNLLLRKINVLLQAERFAPIADRSLILSYEHDECVTRQLSQACQIRILWGGDETVRKLRAIAMNPLASEIVFADRFSLAVLDAERVNVLQAKERNDLATHFFNDAYQFDQMACSSPRLVVWVGDKTTCDRAKELFWACVASEVNKRGIRYTEIIGIDKLVSAYLAAAVGCSDRICVDVAGPLSRIHLMPNRSSQFRSLDCGGGFFGETEIGALEDLASLLTERDQTLSYFGFEHAELRKLALSLPSRAIDRIVPIGSALNFDTVWDGGNLMHAFSRELALK